MEIIQPYQNDVPDNQPKWFHSPVTIHKGPLASIRKFLPDFEQRAFALTQSGGTVTRLNENLLTVVRRPLGKESDYIPVGTVSHSYTLVQHTAILDAAQKALYEANIDSAKINTELKITQYGERMSLSLFLPEAYNYYGPDKRDPTALRLECLNSVDGSTRFQALMGWFRFVCSNGMVIGVTQSNMRRRHTGTLNASDIGIILKQGIKDAEVEKQNFGIWRETKIRQDNLTRWIEDDVHKTWGFKAATRVFHISMTGHDVRIDDQYKGKHPTTINVSFERTVPGTNGRAETLYDISQVLAWLAKERRDIQEQVEWRGKIPVLINALKKSSKSKNIQTC